tara:strand:- start:651 stop:857 length:207 start_codon:yes stop_codon:yes gene_type:complete
MKKIKNVLRKLSNRAIGVQGTLFLVFAIVSLIAGQESTRFWMFMIASIVFSALQTIIDQLKELNNNKL